MAHVFSMRLFGWLALLGKVALQSAGAAAESAEYLAQRFTTDDGLPQTRVSCLAQTPDGYLWCGTWYGLARFDGVRFVTFDQHNTPAFSASDDVRALAVDREGFLWVGTPNALVRQTPQGWAEVPWSPAWGGGGVKDLWPRESGGVWVAGGAGLFCSQSTHLTFATSPSAEVPPRFAVARSGALYCCEITGGVNHWWALDAKSDSWLELPPEVKPWDPADAAAALTIGDEWLYSRRGAFRVERRGMPEEGQPSRVGLYQILAAAPATAGGLWMGDRDGRIWHMRPGQGRPSRLDFPPIGPGGVAALLEDQEGNLWVSGETGLFRLRRRVIQSFAERDGLAADETWSVSPAQGGGVWVGSQRGGVARIVNGRVESQPSIVIGSGNRPTIHAVLEDSRGRLFANGSHAAGVFELVSGKWKRWPGTGADGAVLYEDRNRRMWIGGKDGVAFLDGNQWRRWTSKHGPLQADVRVIYQSRDGRFWLGTRGAGLIRLNEQSGDISRLASTNGLSSDEVWAIHETGDGSIWIGGNRGLARLEIRKAEFGTRNEAITIISFTPAHGLPDDVVNWILEDDQGYLWLSGLRGIHRVARAELAAVARGEIAAASCATFGVADGMEVSETNGEQAPAGCVDSDGCLWFPTGKGVVRIDPRLVNITERAPAVVIEGVEVDGIEAPRIGFQMAGKTETLDSLKLPPGRARVVRFQYTAPTMVNAQRARFRHRLLGLNDQWRQADEERVAYFTNLKPGDYKFEVTACNAHGDWQKEPARFSFALAPSFTQTLWYPASLAVGGILLAAAFVTWRLRWQRRALRAEQSAHVAEERARIARDLHDDLGTALTGVALELDVARRETPPSTAGRLATAASHTRVLADKLREVVWVINPRCDTTQSLALHLEQQAVPFLESAGIACRLDYPDELPRWPAPANTRHQLVLAVRETLTNVVRHSRATEVGLKLVAAADELQIEVRDNGCGFAPDRVVAGQGLANLRERLAALGGTVQIESRVGAGTRVQFRVPLNSKTKGGQ